MQIYLSIQVAVGTQGKERVVCMLGVHANTPPKGGPDISLMAKVVGIYTLSNYIPVSYVHHWLPMIMLMN